MQCSKSLWLLTLSLCAAFSMQAQTTGNPQDTPPAQAPAPEQTEPIQPLTPSQPTPLTRDPLAQAQQQQGGASSSTTGTGPQTNYPNEQDRIRLAREAQARVRARREQRTQATIQDTYSHKYDLYFGYVFSRVRPGHDLQHMNEYGWNVGITRYLNQKLGVTADLRGQYVNAYTGFVRAVTPGGGPIQGAFKPFISNYSVMVGPQYYVKQRKNYAISAQVLAGATHNLFNANSAGLSGTLVGLYPNETRFTAAVAVPVDTNLGPGLAFRVAPTYQLTTWGGDVQHNLGFTIALNYRFGRQ